MGHDWECHTVLWNPTFTFREQLFSLSGLIIRPLIGGYDPFNDKSLRLLIWCFRILGRSSFDRRVPPRPVSYCGTSWTSLFSGDDSCERVEPLVTETRPTTLRFQTGDGGSGVVYNFFFYYSVAWGLTGCQTHHSSSVMSLVRFPGVSALDRRTRQVLLSSEQEVSSMKGRTSQTRSPPSTR